MKTLYKVVVPETILTEFEVEARTESEAYRLVNSKLKESDRDYSRLLETWSIFPISLGEPDEWEVENPF